MKILFLSRWFPFPPNNGAKVRILNLLRVLAANHQITLLSFDDEPEEPSQNQGISSLCERIETIPWKEFEPNSAKSIIGLLSPKPRSVIDTFSPEMAQRIQNLLQEDDFDIIVASEIEMASYYPYFSHRAAIFDEIEIGVPLERFSKAQTTKSRLRYGFTWFKHKYYLKRLLENFPVCTVTSKNERELLIESGIRKNEISIIPNIVNWAEYQHLAGVEKSNSLIFTGSFRYEPNYEAMLWFLEKIFPLILEALPDTQLFITGDHQNLPIPKIKNVTLTGFVDDIQTMIASAGVSIVPLLTGGGTRLKILEAMALHTPVVSTSKGAQGIDISPGENIIIADTPETFSTGVIEILTQPALGKALAESGSRLVQAEYSLEAITSKYERLLQKAIQAHKILEK